MTLSDSVSEHDSDKESVELEIDDYNFKDCSITRKVNPKTDKIKSKTPLPKELTVAQKTKLYIDQVDKKVTKQSCTYTCTLYIHNTHVQYIHNTHVYCLYTYKHFPKLACFVIEFLLLLR